MSHLEREGLREAQRPTDGGFGIMDAFQGCFEDVLKDVHKVQCEFLNAKPAEAVLPKAEISNDGRGEFITFAAITDQQSKKNVANFDQWLDNKTKLKPQAA
jgi:hypothetical protein